MLTYCVFGEYALVEADALGIDGIRFDVPAEGNLVDVVRPFVGSPVAADFLLHDPGRAPELLDAIATTGLPEEQTSLEVFNEPPHKDKVSEAEYIDGVLDVWEECERRHYRGRVIAGAQMNLSIDALRWYANTVPEFPESMTVAFHDYPWGLQSDDRPWPPARSHDEAIANLRAITGARPLVCSEFGRHMAIEWRGQPAVEERLTEEWIYWRYVRRLRTFERNDIVWCALYQWRDAPNATTSEGLYGLHAVHPDGSLGPAKVQAQAIADWHRFVFTNFKARPPL